MMNGIGMFKNNVRQENTPVYTQEGEKIEDIVNVVVNAIPDIAGWANASRQFTDAARQTGERAQSIPKDEVVDVYQAHAIGESLEDAEHRLIPSRSLQDYVVIHKHQVAPTGRPITSHIQGAHRQTRRHANVLQRYV